MNAHPATPEQFRNRRRVVGFAFAGFLIVLIFGLSQCGGGDDDDEATTTIPTPTTDLAPEPTPIPSPTPALGPSPQDVVSQLQTDLTNLGHYSGSAHGNYNDATVAAVQAFQEAAELPTHGTYGSKTAAAIDAALERPAGSTLLQTVLAGLCYYDVEIDGIYGPATEQALLDFQTEANIGVDGLFGPETAATLAAQWASRPATCPSAPDETAEPEEAVAIDPITVTTDGVTITFNNSVVCVIGADDSGSIEGIADDGTTFAATLAGTDSRVVIDGQDATIDVPFTSVSNDPDAITIEAGPPAMTVVVSLASCVEG